LYSVAQATGGQVVLDHYTTSQLNDPRGRKVDPKDMQPGDLVFPAGGDPGHVAIYAGDGMVWHAPDFGQTVSKAPIADAVGASFDVRRFL
jgi:cell wall-associated NlpC family hydrolase